MYIKRKKCDFKKSNNCFVLGTSDSPISKLTSPKNEQNLNSDVVFSVVTPQTLSANNHADDILWVFD